MIDNKQIGMDINIIQQLHNRTHIKNTYLRLARARSTARAYVTLKGRAGCQRKYKYPSRIVSPGIN